MLLLLSSLAWGISFGGVVLPWSQVSYILNGLGLEKVPDAPMFIYWFKMTAGALGFIGVIFIFLAINPIKYKLFTLIAGCFMMIEGFIILIYGLLLKLPPIPFYFDVIFCVLNGLLIIILVSRCHAK